MREIYLRLELYRKENRELILKINENNFLKAKFLIKKELEKLREKLRSYEKRNIISSMKHRNPKIKIKKYKKRINDICYSRITMLNALKVISKTFI